MKNIFYTIVFFFFIQGLSILSMDNQVSDLEKIKSINIKDGVNVAYLQNNKILITAKNQNALQVFDLDNQDPVFLQLPEPVGRMIIERDIYGKNAYLARKASSDGQTHKSFFIMKK